MEAAEEDLEVVAWGTLEGLVEGKVVEVGGQPEDCEGEGRELEVGVGNRESLEVVELEVELGAR
eukprot:SM000051S17618  [mRNA]  locus=s51:613098:613307:+ [translate_table: standard]